MRNVEILYIKYFLFLLPQVVTYLPGLRPLSTMELYTDTYYIQRIQAGDVACFACLLDKYSRPIHSLILKVVRSQEEAEELAQDTFMKVFKNLASFKGDCSFSTWIYRIAYNRLRRLHLKTYRRRRLRTCSDKPNPRNRFKDWKSPLNNFYQTNGP